MGNAYLYCELPELRRSTSCYFERHKLEVQIAGNRMAKRLCLSHIADLKPEVDAAVGFCSYL